MGSRKERGRGAFKAEQWGLDLVQQVEERHWEVSCDESAGGRRIGQWMLEKSRD